MMKFKLLKKNANNDTLNQNKGFRVNIILKSKFGGGLCIFLRKVVNTFLLFKFLLKCHVYKWGGKGEIVIHDYLTRFTDLIIGIV